MARKASASTTTTDGTRDAGPLPRIALFHGPEQFLREQHTRELKARLEREHGELEVVTFDGQSTDSATVLDECRSFGLIARHKLVVVNDAEDLVKAKDEADGHREKRESPRTLFERYAQRPSEGATLVLRASSWKAGNLDKMIEAVGVIVVCKEVGKPEAIALLRSHAKHELKVQVEQDALTTLVERVGEDLLRLHAELGKLASTAGQGAITRAMVLDMVGESKEEKVWSLHDVLLTGDAPSMLARLRHLLDVQREPVPLVMFAIFDLARKLHALRSAMNAGENPVVVAKELRIWNVQPFLKALDRMSHVATLGFLKACVQQDERAKSGLTSHDRALEVLVVRLARSLGGARPQR